MTVTEYLVVTGHYRYIVDVDAVNPVEAVGNEIRSFPIMGDPEVEVWERYRELMQDWRSSGRYFKIVTTREKTTQTVRPVDTWRA